jgi:leucyl-tRNA synthetase
MVPFVQLLQPFAPHLAEELWEMLGEDTVLSRTPWPSYDENLVRDQQITIAVQVMGKTRGTLEIVPELGQSEIESLAQKIHAVANQLQGKQVKKIIFVKGKIINFICG